MIAVQQAQARGEEDRVPLVRAGDDAVEARGLVRLLHGPQRDADHDEGPEALYRHQQVLLAEGQAHQVGRDQEDDVRETRSDLGNHSSKRGAVGGGCSGWG